ncbi:MAG: NADH-quinone oxidoreductase subunit D, partial [Planctomycetaceae bacterium]
MSLVIEDPRVVEFDVQTDEMLVNMGPQHPSTHGVLRLLLRTDGEIVHVCTPHIGYLHRCAEKIGENLSPPQYIPYTDRMDYLAAMNMNLGFSLAVEKLTKTKVPARGVHLRVLIAELGRIASHLVGMGAYGLDLGTFSPFLYAFREREIILDLFEEACGARLTYSYLTVGGATHDLPEEIEIPDGLASLTGRRAGERYPFLDVLEMFLQWLEPRIWEYHTLLTRNAIFIKRTAGLGILTPEMAVSYGCTGPVLRGSGVDFDLRRDGESIYTDMYKGYEYAIPVAPFADAPREVVVGDNWCRFYVRMMEVVQSISLVRQAIKNYVATPGPVRENFKLGAKLPKDEVY